MCTDADAGAEKDVAQDLGQLPYSSPLWQQGLVGWGQPQGEESGWPRPHGIRNMYIHQCHCGSSFESLCDENFPHPPTPVHERPTTEQEIHSAQVLTEWGHLKGFALPVRRPDLRLVRANSAIRSNCLVTPEGLANLWGHLGMSHLSARYPLRAAGVPCTSTTGAFTGSLGRARFPRYGVPMGTSRGAAQQGLLLTSGSQKMRPCMCTAAGEENRRSHRT